MRVCPGVEIARRYYYNSRNWQISRERFREFSFVKHGEKKKNSLTRFSRTSEKLFATRCGCKCRDEISRVSLITVSLYILETHTHKSNATILFSFTCSRYRVERITSDYRTIALYAVKWRLIGKIWFVSCA